MISDAGIADFVIAGSGGFFCMRYPKKSQDHQIPASTMVYNYICNILHQASFVAL
jgi:hypothetical protein